SNLSPPREGQKSLVLCEVGWEIEVKADGPSIAIELAVDAEGDAARFRNVHDAKLALRRRELAEGSGLADCVGMPGSRCDAVPPSQELGREMSLGREDFRNGSEG